jgi:flagellar biosynthesis protein FlhG
MTDQASTLRLMATIPPTPPTAFTDGTRNINMNSLTNMSHTRTIAVTGGKGGVGKSNVAVNVALELAALGRRVSLLDADLALANADVLLGINPTYHLGHVLSGQRTLAEVVIEVEEGIRLLPGGSGIEELANLSFNQNSRLIAELRAMEEESDFMVIDTAAGIASNVMGVLYAADEVIIVTTPDPTAVVDAYAMIKVMHQHSTYKPIWVVVNEVVGIGDADQVFNQLRGAAMRFLNHQIEYLGMIPQDSQLVEAVREQTPVVNYAPETAASRALRLIAKTLDQKRHALNTNSTGSFWTTFKEINV